MEPVNVMDVAPNIEPMEFDCSGLLEVPVKIKCKDGVTREYVLREMDTETQNRYLNASAGRARKDADGKVVGVQDFTGIQASLLCLCMFDKGDGAPVSLPTVQGWPSRVTQALHKRALEISGMGDKAEADAKKP
jgi:hypothetical protein